MKIGYILDRGTDNSNLIKKMKVQGVNKIIVDINLDQEQYQTMLLESVNSMMENDVLVINTLDDLGASLEDIINVIKKLDEKNIGIQVLNLNTDSIGFENSKNNHQSQRMIGKFLLSLLIWLENKRKREIKKQEVKEVDTIKALKEKSGAGRPKKYSKYAKDMKDREIYFSVIDLLKHGVAIKRISEELNISRNTIYKIRGEWSSNDCE
ncbi:helix-turn-helix domain-containing protein [Heyndrickxia ginsengihumi]|uniref:helix-turn-helix domain-containing protein n=1 Tax=Heyndrickxia ginsengihumi TaxID=363870 RepID=UPI00046EC5CC|nr:helix-turn-helix domain-containing protein [Heyndrickxia ginsengihumi]